MEAAPKQWLNLACRTAPGLPEAPNLERMGPEQVESINSPDVEERAVREHRAEHEPEWAAIESSASKIGCTSETLRK